MNSKLTPEQQQFVMQARAKLELAIAERTHLASKQWVERLASETSPILSRPTQTIDTVEASPIKLDNNVVSVVLQSLFTDHISRNKKVLKEQKQSKESKV